MDRAAALKIDLLLGQLKTAEIGGGVSYSSTGVSIWMYREGLKHTTFFSGPLEGDPDTSHWPDLQAAAFCLEHTADRLFGTSWRFVD
jgi:hypothetical protein